LKHREVKRMRQLQQAGIVRMKVANRPNPALK
jgi:hypothetical protein